MLKSERLRQEAREQTKRENHELIRIKSDMDIESAAVVILELRQEVEALKRQLEWTKDELRTQCDNCSIRDPSSYP